MSSEVRPELPAVSGSARARRLLLGLGLLMTFFVATALIDIALGGSDDPVGGTVSFAVLLLVLMVVLPPLEYRLYRWKAGRKADTMCLEQGTVVPCGVLEWSADRGHCIPGGLQLPGDGSIAIWRPLTDTDERQLVLSPETVRVAGFRSPKARERWGVASGLVILVLMSDTDEESHLCLTKTDARTVAALFRPKN